MPRSLWVAGLSVVLSLCLATQGAFGFFHHHKKAAPAPAAEPACDCMPAPTCCTPAPSCCAPAPIFSAPASAPVYSAPAPSCCGTPAPLYSAPVYSAPVYSAPVYSAPVYSAPAPDCCGGAPAPAAAPAKGHLFHGLFGK